MGLGPMPELFVILALMASAIAFAASVVGLVACKLSLYLGNRVLGSYWWTFPLFGTMAGFVGAWLSAASRGTPTRHILAAVIPAAALNYLLGMFTSEVVEKSKDRFVPLESA